MASHTGRVLNVRDDGLMEGSGGNEPDEPPKNETTQNGKAAAPQLTCDSSP
jgi:hypothetical protein